MKLGILAKHAGKLANDNSPAILTAIGVTGAVMTAYLTGKASFKAANVIRDHVEDRKQEIGYDDDGICRESVFVEHKTMVDLTWKLFVPAVGTGLMTITCILAANHIGTRRSAALASAYTISEKAFAEYKEKVIKNFGEKKEQSVRDEIAQDKVNRLPPREIIVASGDVLCCDLYTRRYFTSDMESLRRAVNDLNQKLIHESYVSLTDFYDLVGLEKTAESDEVGWTTDNLVEVEYSTTLSPDNRPCITVDFSVLPVRRFYKSYL